jgi:neutral ceramidase
LKAAFYEKEITPPLGCSIPGYFNERLGSGVKDKLFAKACVISDGNNKVAILSIDACYVLDDTCQKIIKRIEEYTPLKSESIMICATHTHTGGPAAANDDRAIDEFYLEMLEYTAADCVILAYKKLNECNTKYAKGNVDSISFNRNYIMKDGTVRTNPGRLNPDIVKPFAGIDPELLILYFEDKHKKPCGAIVNFACHLDCVDGTEYSGDFASVISKELKSIYGEDFVSVLVLGACGNINHFDVSKQGDAPDHYVKMGKILAEEAIRAIKNSEDIKGNIVTSDKQYIKIKRRLPNDEEIAQAKEIIENTKLVEGVKLASDSAPDQFNLAMAQNLMKSVDGEEERSLYVQVTKIGNCLIYALPCEVFYQFGVYIKENSPLEKNIVATLCNGSSGYIPIRELFLPYIYEAKLNKNSMVPEAGYIISDKALEMSEKIVRDMHV